tara:strand:- start:2890 stop:4218 length:1329 start_codon:yes stop_codon:yes gene_type:complete
MGLRAQNNPNNPFEDIFSSTGTNAAGARAAPTGWNGTGASGGTTYDYTSPEGEYRIHKFTSTSATPFSAPAAFDRKIKYIIVGGGGGGSSPDHDGGGGAGGGGAGALHDLTDGDHLTGSGIDLTGPFNFNVTCGAGGNGGFVPAPTGDGDGAPGGIANGGTWQGSDGGDTTVAFPTGTITAAGGGCGGYSTPPPGPPTTMRYGRPGGSGGGAALYTPNLGGTASGAPFPGTPGDSPPAGWGGAGGRGGTDPNPHPPMNPFYMAGGGGGAGGDGRDGGDGSVSYPSPPDGATPPDVNWKVSGRGGLGYQIPVIFQDPSNVLFKGPSGPDHWLAGGGGGGIYKRTPDPQDSIPAPYCAGGGGGLLAALPLHPEYPFPGGQGWAGAGSGGVGATPSQGGSPMVDGTSANANSGSGGGAGAGGKSPTKSSGDGGTGIVLLAYCIDT